jgi:hypothetical protein
MFKSLRFRLIASYLLIVLLAMGIAAGLSWVALDRAFLGVLRENLLAQAERVAQVIEAGGAGDMITAGVIGEEYSQSANVMPGYHTRVVDEEGVVILDLATADAVAQEEAPAALSLDRYGRLLTNFDIRAEDAHDQRVAIPLSERPEIHSALAGEPATAVRAYSWAPDRRVLYAAYPVRSAEDSVVSVVYVASPLPRFSLTLLPTTFGPQVLGGVGCSVGRAGWFSVGAHTHSSVTPAHRRRVGAGVRRAGSHHSPDVYHRAGSPGHGVQHDER